MIGNVIEHYRIISVLGEGGMGIVYKALDLKLERFVAIKILNIQSVSNSQQFIDRFRREAKNQAKLNHSNIVQVYGFTEERGVLGIVMEYVEGETVEHMLDRKGILELNETLDIVKQSLQGVAYAHSKGFIHRDIKPSNIIVNHDGIAKIMDFGISRSMFEKGITKTGTKIGTILYMSPEQIKAEEPNQQSDIYSMGITFFEMLVGKTPFDYETEFEIMEGHLKKTPTRVSAEMTHIPPEVDMVIGKSLAKSVKKRYHAVSDFLFDVEQLLDKYGQTPVVQQKKATKITKEVSHKPQKWKISLVAFFSLSIMTIVAYFVVNMITDIWSNIGKGTEPEPSFSESGYKNNPNYILKSNWTKLNSGTNTTLNSVYFIDDTVGIVCGNNGIILKTSDNGDSWRQIDFFEPLSLNDVYFVDNFRGYIVGESGLILESTDRGESWNRINNNLPNALFDIYFIDRQNGFAVGDEGTILRTNDSGNSWRIIPSPTSELLYAIHFVNNKKGFISGWNGKILFTENSGDSWRELNSFTETYIKDIQFITENTGFAVGGGGLIYITEDGGKTWKQIDSKIFSGLTSIHFPNNKFGLITGSKGEILTSSDSGKSWDVLNTGVYSGLNKVITSPSNINFAVGINGTIISNK